MAGPGVDVAADAMFNFALAATERGKAVHLMNAYSMALANRSPSLAGVLRGDALCLCDSSWIELAIRLLHPREAKIERVPGPDLFEAILRKSQDSGRTVGHYFLGGAPDTLASLQRQVARRYPSVIISGVESPPFRPLTSTERVEQLVRIKQSGANIVWVGLGTPKQDFHVAWLAAELPVLAVAVGAAFDFSAGTLSRAPQSWRKLRLEWLYRLVQEPARLWRRYIIDSPQVLFLVLRNARTAEKRRVLRLRSSRDDPRNP